MENWDSLVKRVIAPSNEVKIAFVGKYVDLKESYKSLTEAIIHAGAALDTKVELKWVDSEKLENMESSEVFKDVSGILVAGGFGYRGVEGKIKAIQYARENKISFRNLFRYAACFGEFARNVLKLKDVNSSEFNEKCQKSCGLFD